MHFAPPRDVIAALRPRHYRHTRSDTEPFLHASAAFTPRNLLDSHTHTAVTRKIPTLLPEFEPRALSPYISHFVSPHDIVQQKFFTHFLFLPFELHLHGFIALAIAFSPVACFGTLHDAFVTFTPPLVFPSVAALRGPP